MTATSTQDLFNSRAWMPLLSLGSALVGVGIGAISQYYYQRVKSEKSSGSGCPFAFLAKNLPTEQQSKPAAAAPFREVEKLTPEQIKIVKSTAPVFKEHGVEITKIFYKNLFKAYPELYNYFNITHQKTGQQQAALAHAVWAYAENIDNLGALSGAVQHIAHKHAALNVQAAHYPIVGKFLLQAVKEYLGDAITDEILEAWRVAYGQLADIFINLERNLMDDAAKAPHGWHGWKQFVITKKIKESDQITSFYLTPADGSKVPRSKPGQYISVKRHFASEGYDQPRQYTLSGNDGSSFRISVKRDQAAGQTVGIVSGELHDKMKVGDKIEVAPPFGEFYLDESANTPVVLISGGVGLTPCIAMLDAGSKQNRKVVYVHAARNHKAHAMQEHVKGVVAKHSNVTSSVWYSSPLPESRKGIDYDHEGRIVLRTIENQILLPNADYYICGPQPFMENIQSQLLALNVPANKIHSEVFGSDSRS